MYKFDHIYPGGRTVKEPVVILYGELGTPELAAAHKNLAQRATEGELRYVLRHFVREPSKRKLRLSGYGVELAIKSTEYKAKDDTKVEGQSNIVLFLRWPW